MDADEVALFGEFENDALFNYFPDDYFLNSDYDSLESGQRNQVSSEQKKCSAQTNVDLDYAIALSLQDEFNDGAKENEDTNSKKYEASKPLSIVDDQWELIDPHPDIHALFIEYDNKFFYGKLKCVEVRWSPRMTLCAGICSYQGRGGLCSIGLSAPLLKLRPRRDLVETLLHEMIHAYLFVTANNKDRDGHGPEFLKHMHRINKESGTNITVYHSFHAEVNLYKTHWWKCDGPCRNKSPYFGLVKRATNRAPGPNDPWWGNHQQSCGGKFIKIKEPSNYGQKKVPKRRLPSDLKSKPSDIRKFIKSGSLEESNKESNELKGIESPALGVSKKSPPKRSSSGVINATDTPKKKSFIPFQGTGQKLGTSSTTLLVPPSSNSSAILNDLQIKKPKFPSNLPRKAEIIGTSTSPRNNLIKKVVSSVPSSKKKSPPCSSSKASATKKLFSSSPTKIITLDDFYSSSPKIPTAKDLSGKHSTPSGSLQSIRISNANKNVVQSGLVISSEATSSKAIKSEKSDFQNRLSHHNTSTFPQKSSDVGINLSSGVNTKLFCPVCSNVVDEEINAHLDKCLKNTKS